MVNRSGDILFYIFRFRNWQFALDEGQSNQRKGASYRRSRSDTAVSGMVAKERAVAIACNDLVGN